MKVDSKEVAEPPARARGAISSYLFYMRDQYDLTLSRQQTQLFNALNKQYPVTDQSERDERIAKVWGTITHMCNALASAKELTYISVNNIFNHAPAFRSPGHDADV